MTSKEALEKLNFECIRSNGIDDEYSKELKIVEKDLEVLEIIKKNPELVWYCICYECAYEMITHRPSYMIDYSMVEIEKRFNKVKEWMKNE